MANSQFLPIETSATQALQAGTRRMKKFYWYNPTNIGDTVLVQDQNGSTIWRGRCEVANEAIVFDCPREIEVSGYIVPTLGSGTLFIYCV